MKYICKYCKQEVKDKLCKLQLSEGFYSKDFNICGKCFDKLRKTLILEEKTKWT